MRLARIVRVYLNREVAGALLAVVLMAVISACGQDEATAPKQKKPEPRTPVVGWTGPGIRSVCVETAATFEGEPVSTEQAFGSVSAVDALVGSWAVEAVPPGSACDATLRMEFTGIALSGTYGAELQELYVGYDVSGQVTLAAPNQPTLSYPFAERDEPQEYEVLSEPLPTAPSDVLEESTVVPLGPAVEQFFGPAPPSNP